MIHFQVAFSTDGTMMCSGRFGTDAGLANGTQTISQLFQIFRLAGWTSEGGKIVEEDISQEPVAHHCEDNGQARTFMFPVESESNCVHCEHHQTDHPQYAENKETAQKPCVTFRKLQQWLHEDIDGVVKGELRVVEEGAEPVFQAGFPIQVPEGRRGAGGKWHDLYSLLSNPCSLFTLDDDKQMEEEIRSLGKGQ